MNDNVIDTLKAADPARRMPVESAAIREGTRENILRSDARPDRLSAKPRPTRSRRLVMAALAAALVVVVIPSAAWAYFSYFGDRETVLAEYHAAQNEMPLPDGATWDEPNLPRTMSTAVAMASSLPGPSPPTPGCANTSPRTRRRTLPGSRPPSRRSSGWSRSCRCTRMVTPKKPAASSRSR